MTTISNDLFIQNQPQAESKQNNVLGKDDFLRLLIAQLQNQDPLNPMEDREFIAQMANFSSLEQMTNLNKSMDGFIETQTTNNVLSLQQYIGSEITWQHSYEEGGETFVETKTGVVASVAMNDGKARLVAEDGSEVSIYDIVNVSHNGGALPVQNSSLLQASQLIGKKVTLVLGNETYENSLVESVLSKDGKTYFTVTNSELINQKIPLDTITKISQ